MNLASREYLNHIKCNRVPYGCISHINCILVSYGCIKCIKCAKAPCRCNIWVKHFSMLYGISSVLNAPHVQSGSKSHPWVPSEERQLYFTHVIYVYILLWNETMKQDRFTVPIHTYGKYKLVYMCEMNNKFSFFRSQDKHLQLTYTHGLSYKCIVSVWNLRDLLHMPSYIYIFSRGLTIL